MPLNYAVVGTSVITQMFIDAAKRVDGLRLYAVYSRTLSKASRLAGKNGGVKSFDNLQALLNDDQLDVIYLASPNALHFQHIMAALEQGKHVICEKPLVSNYREFCQVVDLAEKKGCFLFEAITTLYLPNFLELRRQLSTIGPIKLIKVEYSRTSDRYLSLKKGIVTNVLDPCFSGGSLMDLGVYCIHTVQGLFGPPEDVVCYANLWSNGIDTSAAMLLRYPDKIALLSCSKDSFSANLTQIQGERGCLLMEGIPGVFPKIMLVQNGQTKDISIPQDAQHMLYEISTFTNAISQGNRSFCRNQLNHSGKVIRTLDQARQSAGIYFPSDKI